MSIGTIEDLRKVNALKDLPEDHLKWILAHCEYREYEDGQLMFKTGDPANEMAFIVEGKLVFYLDVNNKLVHYYNFENDPATGGVSGLLPYSRMKFIPGNSYASGKLRAYSLNKVHFPELERLNPEFIQKLIGYMTERVRHFATQKLQHEKVNALGQLAAGIAHELNNPAAAINHISAELNRRLMVNYDLTKSLLDNKIPPEIIKEIQERVELKKKQKSEKKLSAMQKMEKEDELFEWMEKNCISIERQTAETLNESGFTTDELKSIKELNKDNFNDVLLWMENVLTSQKLIKDLDDAACRISNLVGAIKSHVHMDRTNEILPTDVHKDIDNTLTLLGYKLRDKNISVSKKFCVDMPKVPAYIGELNQVWTNIIDNAIFAMEKNGELSIVTDCSDKEVNVHIVDNGKGIPQEIGNRIFDPFFTTKKVGEGTGIGLDLVSRIVKRHNGEVKFNSAPGRTEFTVCLPLNNNISKPASIV
jgi:signal transduction histidine kinase